MKQEGELWKGQVNATAVFWSHSSFTRRGSVILQRSGNEVKGVEGKEGPAEPFRMSQTPNSRIAGTLEMTSR